MKAACLAPLFAAALAIGAPAPKAAAPAALTAARKAAVLKEVEPVIKALFAAAEKLEVEAATALFADVPEFRYAGPDGKSFSHAELKKLAAEVWGGFARQALPIRSARTLVLAEDLVLYAWDGSNDMIAKDGAVLRADPMAGSYLFRKAGGAWKCIHAHESGPDFQPVKPEPKAGAQGLPELTPEQRWRQMGYQGHWAMVAFLLSQKEAGRTAEQAGAWMAKVYGPTWAKEMRPRDMMQALYRNTLMWPKGEFELLEDSPDLARFRTSRPWVGYFGKEGAAYGARAEDIDASMGSFLAAVARERGMTLEWKVDGDRCAWTVRKP